MIYSLLALLDFTASISYESIRGPWLWDGCVSHGWDFPGCIPWCHRNAEPLASGKFGDFYPKSPLAHRLIIFTPKNTILGSMYYIYTYYTIYMYMYYINIYTYSQLEELQSSNLRNRSWDPWHPHSGVGFEAGTWRDDPPTMALCREIGRSRHRPNNGMFDVKTLADYMVVEILCILSINHSKYHSIAI